MIGQFQLTDDQLANQEMAHRPTADSLALHSDDRTEGQYLPHDIEPFRRSLPAHSIVKRTNKVVSMITGRDLLKD